MTAEGGLELTWSSNRGCSSMVEQKPSKLMTRVRFPSPAPTFAPSALRSASRACAGLNRSGLAAGFSDDGRGLALASTTGHEKLAEALRRPQELAQWLEHRSPKPGVGGSNPSTPANKNQALLTFPGFGLLCLGPFRAHSPGRVVPGPFTRCRRRRVTSRQSL